MGDQTRDDFSRRQFLKVAAAAGVVVGAGGLLEACTTAATAAPATPAPATPAPGVSAAPATAAPSAAPVSGTFNWMTWSDHWYQAQMDILAANNNIKSNITSFSDNIDAYTKVKQVGGQIDMVSGDALWVPHYFENGLIDAFDINSLQVAKQLYSVARSFPIWTKPEGYLGYPFGWSPVQVYYDPAHVSPPPDSWELLIDPKYKKRVVVEDQPVEIMAYMASSPGSRIPTT